MFLISPISSYCYDLMKTLSVSGKSFTAVTLAVPSTWPLNCAHVILIHSAESCVWYFINILLFHVQELFNWFSKNVWYRGEDKSLAWLLPGVFCLTLRIFRLMLIHSFSILSDDRSKASSKTMPAYSAMQSLLLQMRISSPVLKVIQ